MNNKWMTAIQSWCRTGKGIRLLVVLGVIGMGMILVSELLPETEETDNAETVQSAVDELAYADAMETALCEVLSQIQGVGETQVFLTLSGTAETIYAEEISKEVSETASRSETQYVLVGTSGAQNALVTSIRNPQIAGVIVVCAGGASSVVQEQVYHAVSVACGIPTADIHVAALETKP